MGLLQREKGKRFERLVADLLRKAMPGCTVRRSLQAHRAYEPDVVVEGSPLWLELTHGKAPDPEAKLRQAERDAERSGTVRWKEPIPLVVWRRHGERSIRATLRLGSLLRLHGIETTTTGPVVTLAFEAVLEHLTKPGGMP